jgi:hypothetical protein
MLRFGMIASSVASRPMFGVPLATDNGGKMHRRNKDPLANPKGKKQVVEYEKRKIAKTLTSDQLSDASSAKDDIEAFGRAISLQAAARTARYAERSLAVSDESRRAATRTIGIRLEKRAPVSLTPSFNLVVASAIGVVVFACITYLMMGGALLRQ